MILVDTSVWIDHLRSSDGTLVRLLERGEVAGHAFVTGELACGSLRTRNELLALLSDLPQATIADHLEVLFFIDRHQLMGVGIGYVDAHLLASASLSPELEIWTRDKRLGAVATQLGLGFPRGA